MSISISSSTPVQAPQKASPTEATRGGKDVSNDSDSDDGATTATPASAPKPVTNTLGQLIGANLNVTA
ncbi:hypothetical protein [Rhodoferax sp.]|uniref:hypothetical protein n=1 Tax=Rhodoferax sp. TaxID=50421 RepID=UPI002849E515|nr:hypothetical protein [Rhodoferax sp.]MDR3369151.1 hypothetical protein [Rhodoferax sp.]